MRVLTNIVSQMCVRGSCRRVVCQRGCRACLSGYLISWRSQDHIAHIHCCPAISTLFIEKGVALRENKLLHKSDNNMSTAL